MKQLEVKSCREKLLSSAFFKGQRQSRDTLARCGNAGQAWGDVHVRRAVKKSSMTSSLPSKLKALRCRQKDKWQET